jgi:predicted nucleotide-binding protein
MADDLDVFEQLRHATLDMQGADYQTYEKPLRRICKLLSSPGLAEANRELTNGLTLEKFLRESQASGGGMVGSNRLAWPDDENEQLGITLLLILKMGDEPRFLLDFGLTYFSSSSKHTGALRVIVGQLIIPFLRDYKAFILNNGKPEPKVIMPKSNKIFIVHGQDVAARESMARFIEHLGFEAVILHEQANRGGTIIEKIEANRDVGFAIVLLTPDDEGRRMGDLNLAPRARQNVLLELGYFMAYLGRPNICALRRGDVDIPSDFAGVVWTDLDPAGAWKTSLGRELTAAGYSLDWNKVMA